MLRICVKCQIFPLVHSFGWCASLSSVKFCLSLMLPLPISHVTSGRFPSSRRGWPARNSTPTRKWRTPWWPSSPGCARKREASTTCGRSGRRGSGRSLPAEATISKNNRKNQAIKWTYFRTHCKNCRVILLLTYFRESPERWAQAFTRGCATLATKVKTVEVIYI